MTFNVGTSLADLQREATIRTFVRPAATTAVIPALLVSGIDSDLPGPILAQVSQNVFDTSIGRYLLVPQGSKLVGSYQSASVYGQERVQILWERLIFPNASSIELAGMPEPMRAATRGSLIRPTITTWKALALRC